MATILERRLAFDEAAIALAALAKVSSEEAKRAGAPVSKMWEDRIVAFEAALKDLTGTNLGETR